MALASSWALEHLPSSINVCQQNALASYTPGASGQKTKEQRFSNATGKYWVSRSGIRHNSSTIFLSWCRMVTRHSAFLCLYLRLNCKDLSLFRQNGEFEKFPLSRMSETVSLHYAGAAQIINRILRPAGFPAGCFCVWKNCKWHSNKSLNYFLQLLDKLA